jgi:tetratricopeptide (TPR) repeat protein
MVMPRSWCALPVLLLALQAMCSTAFADNADTCKQGAGDERIAACTRVIAAGRGNLAWAYNNRGVGYRAKGDNDHAIADYDAAIRLDPKDAVAYSNRGIAYRVKGDNDRAIADSDHAIRLNPKYAAAYNNRGLAYRAKGDNDRAIPDYDAAIRLDPKFAAAYTNRGDYYRTKGDNDRAIADYDAAIRLDPKAALAYNNRGNAYSAKGDNDRAMADYDAAIRLNPKDAHPYANRGMIYRAKGDNDRAIADYDQAIQLDPKYTFAYAKRGDAYRAKSDNDRAIADYDAAIRLDPKYALAYNNRGNAYYAKGNNDRAIADYDEAIRLNPKGAIVYDNRGNAYRRKGDNDRAIADYITAIQLDPVYTAAFTNRGLAYEKIGDRERARADFNAALALPQKDNSGKWAHGTARARLAVLDAGPATTTAGVQATAAPGAPGGRRVALVIGNSSYAAVPALPNPRRDAEAVAAGLREVGFQSVTVINDASREALVKALSAFGREADNADWAVVYYAGHGMEVGGSNYLIPIDARLASDRDVSAEAISLDQLIGYVEGARKLRVVLLDACRENPFAAKMARRDASRSVGRGLARVEPEGGTLVAYAAKDGQIAQDGSGTNSPFVAALVKRLPTPGMEINKLFRLVHDDVMAATGRKQEPYVYGALPGEDFFFMAGKQ